MVFINIISYCKIWWWSRQYCSWFRSYIFKGNNNNYYDELWWHIVQFIFSSTHWCGL